MELDKIQFNCSKCNSVCNAIVQKGAWIDGTELREFGWICDKCVHNVLHPRDREIICNIAGCNKEQCIANIIKMRFK